ncbi:MAG: hypothetical protein KGJ07_00880, partial [Patescibacteria group bacterium]|nr:hypothetical protein [Patescibacteria group bacterium]
MISILLVSKTKEAREAYVAQLCTALHIDQFDRTIFQPQTSLGIDDVREIQKKALFKPLKSSEKAIIIYDAHLATTEAQNALLKLLEEPPTNTRIILTASSIRPFLPTVLSRCKIIELDSTTKTS